MGFRKLTISEIQYNVKFCKPQIWKNAGIFRLSPLRDKQPTVLITGILRSMKPPFSPIARRKLAGYQFFIFDIHFL